MARESPAGHDDCRLEISGENLRLPAVRLNVVMDTLIHYCVESCNLHSSLQTKYYTVNHKKVAVRL